MTENMITVALIVGDPGHEDLQLNQGSLAAAARMIEAMIPTVPPCAGSPVWSVGFLWGRPQRRGLVGCLWALSETRTAATTSVRDDQPLADSRTKTQEVPEPGTSVNAGT